MPTILVRGTGDVGSAVAHLLFAAGHRVAIHDAPAPPHSRRGMAFVDAIFDGSCLLEGTLAKRCDDAAALPRMLTCRKAVPISIDDLDAVLDAIRPEVLLDARMDKRATPERQIDLASLTVGLGPNFTAGVTTHVAVETAWGNQLGKVITSGTTRPLEGEPRELGGHGRDRFVYAPVAGEFSTRRGIGEWAESGELLGTLAGTDLYAPLSGFIRGLTHSGVSVGQGTKVIEMDPRKVGAVVYGLGERPRRIAEAVLGVIEGRQSL